MVAKPNVNILLEPELLDVLRNLKQEIFRTMNCVKVGQIQSFDAGTQTAQVAIQFKRVLPDNTIADYPVLVGCPVFTLQGGGASLAMPIAPGDQCILLFSDRNLDIWTQNGTAAAPATARCHDLSDGICLVGLNSLANSLASYEDNAVILAYQGATVILKNGLITLANQTTDLLTLMNGMVDVLAALTVQQGSTMLPLSAASIAALEALKAQFATLLQ